MPVTDDSLPDPTAPPRPPDPKPRPTVDPPADAPVDPPAEPNWVDHLTPRRVFWWAVAAALGVLVVYLGALFVYGVRNLLVQITVAAFIAMSLDPLVRWLIRHKVRRPYAVTIVVVTAMALIVGLVWAIVPALVSQTSGLISDFPGFLDNLRERSPSLARLEQGLNLRPRIDAMARELPGQMTAQALGFGQRFLGAILSVLLVVVLTMEKRYALLAELGLAGQEAGRKETC